MGYIIGFFTNFWVILILYFATLLFVGLDEASKKIEFNSFVMIAYIIVAQYNLKMLSNELNYKPTASIYSSGTSINIEIILTIAIYSIIGYLLLF